MTFNLPADFLENGIKLMTSLEIAEATGKQHSNVMRDIRSLIDGLAKSAQFKFESGSYDADFKDDTDNVQDTETYSFGDDETTPYIIRKTTYKDANGQCRAMFELNKKASLLLASGYNITLRAKIIDRWEVLERNNKAEEKQNLPSSYLEALKALVASEEEKERLRIEQQATENLLEDKTQQLDESKEWYSIKRWAKEHHKNWRIYNWRKLKALSYELGYEVKKIFDGNYGEVNIYNRAVFAAAYNE